MRTWALPLVLSAAALGWQLNAKADDDREQWQRRHPRSYEEARRGDHDRDQRDERERRYEEGQGSEGRQAHRHHRHKALHVGPVTIER
jgi:hypothetical protein